jgi:Protein of unknown function (DUF2950)
VVDVPAAVAVVEGRSKRMNSNLSTPLQLRKQRLAGAAAALALAFTLACPGLAHAQLPFAKPELAADALIDALATNDEAQLAQVLGKGWRQVLSLQDTDINDRYAFLAKSSQARQVTLKDGRGFLEVGSDPFTLPVPIVQGKDGQWRFDPVAGREEMAIRRIGANERAAMQAMLAYVDAQREYALADRNGDGVLEYAQKLVSSPGKRDALIWSTQLGDDSPLGEDFAPAKPGQGYHGYRFRILKGQGSAAPGGARSYLIGPRMVSGFALVAWPVRYGTTGVMSFIVNQSGLVYERDLGPDSTAAAAAVQQFNPDAGWKPARP